MKMLMHKQKIKTKGKTMTKEKTKTKGKTKEQNQRHCRNMPPGNGNIIARYTMLPKNETNIK